MGFADVDEEEGGAILVRVVQLFQVARLATERRSGIAAEDQNDRMHFPKTGQGDFLFFV